MTSLLTLGKCYSRYNYHPDVEAAYLYARSFYGGHSVGTLDQWVETFGKQTMPIRASTKTMELNLRINAKSDRGTRFFVDVGNHNWYSLLCDHIGKHYCNNDREGRESQYRHPKVELYYKGQPLHKLNINEISNQDSIDVLFNNQYPMFESTKAQAPPLAYHIGKNRWRHQWCNNVISSLSEIISSMVVDKSSWKDVKNMLRNKLKMTKMIKGSLLKSKCNITSLLKTGVTTKKSLTEMEIKANKATNDTPTLSYTEFLNLSPMVEQDNYYLNNMTKRISSLLYEAIIGSIRDSKPILQHYKAIHEKQKLEVKNMMKLQDKYRQHHNAKNSFVDNDGLSDDEEEKEDTIEQQQQVKNNSHHYRHRNNDSDIKSVDRQIDNELAVEFENTHQIIEETLEKQFTKVQTPVFLSLDGLIEHPEEGEIEEFNNNSNESNYMEAPIPTLEPLSNLQEEEQYPEELSHISLVNNQRSFSDDSNQEHHSFSDDSNDINQEHPSFSPPPLVPINDDHIQSFSKRTKAETVNRKETITNPIMSYGLVMANNNNNTDDTPVYKISNGKRVNTAMDSEDSYSGEDESNNIEEPYKVIASFSPTHDSINSNTQTSSIERQSSSPSLNNRRNDITMKKKNHTHFSKLQPIKTIFTTERVMDKDKDEDEEQYQYSLTSPMNSQHTGDRSQFDFVKQKSPSLNPKPVNRQRRARRNSQIINITSISEQEFSHKIKDYTIGYSAFMDHKQLNKPTLILLKPNSEYKNRKKPMSRSEFNNISAKYIYNNNNLKGNLFNDHRDVINIDISDLDMPMVTIANDKDNTQYANELLKTSINPGVLFVLMR